MTAAADAAALLADLPPDPGYAQVQRVGAKLLRHPPPEQIPASRRVRVALASSFTIDPVAPALAVACHRCDIWPEIYVDGFDLFRSHILDAGSPLYAFGPEVVFLAAELTAFHPTDETGRVGEVPVEATLERVDELITAFTRNSTALLVVHDFATPATRPFALEPDPDVLAVHAVNSRLAERYRSHSQVRVLPFDALCAYHGKSRTTNLKLHYLGAIEVSESFLPLLARHYLSYVRALKGLTRKCVVLDLDGTLWGGVVGEDGIDGIKLARHGPGSEYRDLQARLLALTRRGVILAVCSKNNPADALAVFRQHADMLLREEHFAAWRINWEDKAANLRALAQELNIGLDSLVFLDDNPVERAWVRQAVPEVLTVEFPADPTLYPRTIDELAEFELLTVTDEDRQRGALYAAERSRREYEGTSQSFPDFVKGLKIVLRVSRVGGADVPRVGQLTRKTNQFNLTTRRYSDAEIDSMRRDPGARVYAVRVADAFGDNGLVGVAILHGRGPVWRLDNFLLSCRVLGRTVERAFLAAILADVQCHGGQELEAEFIPTAKNAPAANFLRDFGMASVTGNDQRPSRWRLDLKRWEPGPGWVTVEWEQPESSGESDG